MGDKLRVLKYMRAHGSITPDEAKDRFGCGRLSARIKDLRDCGYDIETITVRGRDRYGEPSSHAQYFLRGDPIVVMTPEEIVKDYQRARYKQDQITILADLNLCSKETIKLILQDAGETIPKGRGKRPGIN